MAQAVTIYHNPRCSKSRETLALLEQQGITPEVVLYLQNPPSQAHLSALLKALKLSARELLRTKEDDYKRLQLDNPKLSEADLIAAMCAHPKLIERPIVCVGKRAVLGRPPQNALTLL